MLQLLYNTYVEGWLPTRMIIKLAIWISTTVDSFLFQQSAILHIFLETEMFPNCRMARLKYLHLIVSLDEILFHGNSDVSSNLFPSFNLSYLGKIDSSMDKQPLKNIIVRV